MAESIRVLFSCTGVGIFNRGIESFFREAFDGLKSVPGLEAHLIKGAGKTRDDETQVWCLPRTGRLAKLIGRCTGRSAYAVEQWSSFPGVVRQIRERKPQVVFYSDANLGFQLFFRRKWIGIPYRLLFSNGGPVRAPFDRTDFVHQVAPMYYEEALRAGEPPQKHFMVPYGIQVPSSPPRLDSAAKHLLRKKLGLPANRKIVLSVGWIASEHKRMDYVINEIARMPKPRPFLQLLGTIDQKSADVIELGYRTLGSENFSARSVAYEMVADFYRAADLFVLASLKEGFGRVYLESLMYGLPTIAHRFPVMEYVLGRVGLLGDLTREGALAAMIANELCKPITQADLTIRWRSVCERFSWDRLASGYYEMFKGVAERK